jgi:glucan-binding YG repeat protein
MAKKLTKAQIAKNPTKAINSGQMKMKKQEVPFGGIGKAAAKAVGKVLGKKTGTKGVVRNPSRGNSSDYVVGGRGSKNMMPKAGKADTNYRFGRDTELSNNVKIKDTKSPSGKVTYTGGTLQVLNQNTRLGNRVSASEAKANARGLKAANKKTTASKRAAADKKIIKLTVRQKAGKAVVNATTGKKSARKYAESQMLRNSLRNLKPLDEVPAGVSARTNATLARLMKEQAKKKAK